MEDTEFKPHPLHTRYAVSRDGRIRNNRTGKMVPVTKHDYDTVALNSKQYRIHRIVAETWIANPEKKKEVNHIDGNRKNNHATNLEWCTRDENQQHAVRSGLMSSRRGIHIEAIDASGRVAYRYNSSIEAAKDRGVNHSAIICALDKSTRWVKGLQWRTQKGDEVVGEIWKPITTVDGITLDYITYEASTAGRIRNVYGRLFHQHPREAYLRVTLYMAHQVRKCFSVHRLVAAAHLGEPPDPSCEVDHIDGNGCNNNVDNLQYLTKAAHGTKTHGVAVAKIGENGQIIETFRSISDAARFTNISSGSIHQAIKRKGFGGGFRWERLPTTKLTTKRTTECATVSTTEHATALAIDIAMTNAAFCESELREVMEWM